MGVEAGVQLETSTYRLDVSADGRWAALSGLSGPPLLRLCLLSALDTVDGPDETTDVGTPELTRPDGSWPVVTITRRSTVWASASLRLDCRDEGLELRAQVQGRGRLADVHLLGGRSLAAGATGFVHTGRTLPTLFSPNPEDPRRLLRSADAPAVVGASGDSLPGRGHWFFTPAPLYLALSHQDLRAAPDAPTPGGWLGLGVLESVDELDCGGLAYVPVDEGFHLRMEYEGHRQVDGAFSAPGLLLTPGQSDPYAGLRSYRNALVARGLAPAPTDRDTPAWWTRPMFCGWGAQCHRDKVVPQAACTQQAYDTFLAELGAEGLVPPTVVIDDGWQREYGRAEPDLDRWPDMAGWIAQRHRAGQRVLLWWKAWDATGVPSQWCVRSASGTPVALDPGHPEGARLLERNVASMLSDDGLGADGLKVDFTAWTPSGRGLTSESGKWGIALLHELLAHLYRAAKATKPDALVVTHTPNPGFVDVTDMIRLNDMLRLEEEHPDSPVVAQMTYRADVVRSACPELLVDTDDWCVPNLEQWREYLALKPQIGVPALYYTTHLDRTGEALTAKDYAALRTLWAAYGTVADD